MKKYLVNFFVCFHPIEEPENWLLSAGKPSPWGQVSDFRRQSAPSISVDFPWPNVHEFVFYGPYFSKCNIYWNRPRYRLLSINGCPPKKSSFVTLNCLFLLSFYKALFHFEKILRFLLVWPKLILFPTKIGMVKIRSIIRRSR